MHGRSLTCLLAATLLGVAGCTQETPPDSPAPQVAETGHSFDAAATGTIEGRVIWEGRVPEVPTLMVLADAENPPPDGRRLFHVPNPFAPQVASTTNGINNAVVFLRRVDPQSACPWPHGAVRVEQVGRKLEVIQNGTSGRMGFVRGGDEIEVVNRDPEYHALRGRGAEFFNLPFVASGSITRKRLDHSGVVDLSSAAGYFWMQAKLLVVEHPYYARTGSGGQFRLEHVPPGSYELVCWMPSWVVVRRERDPESGLISRLAFAPPMEQVSEVTVHAGAASTLDFSWREHQVADAAP
jgi:hypothetical protein